MNTNQIIDHTEQITYHCSTCGNEVEEFCAEHPNALIDSIVSRRLEFVLEARSDRGDWDREYVSWDPAATNFRTLAEAEAALAELVENGRNPDDLRITEGGS